MFKLIIQTQFLIFLMLFALSPYFLIAQQTKNGNPELKSNSNKGWDRQMYATVNHKNFRLNPLFTQKFNSQNPDYSLLNAAIFFLTNEIRAKNQLPLLEYAGPLEIAAWNHCKQMQEKDFFSHTNTKDKTRGTTDERAKLAGIANPAIAENIAMRGGYNSNATYLSVAQSFIDQWMGSKGHRENILSKNALQLGCGVYIGGENCYGTQCFQWYQKIKPGTAKDKLP